MSDDNPTGCLPLVAMFLAALLALVLVAFFVVMP